jgi:hypothetical protein
MIALHLPLRTISTLNAREHWSKRARRAAEHRNLARMALAGPLRAARLTLPAEVTLTRVAPRELDLDNLQGALKSVRDGVADALGVDDRTPLVTWVYQQRRGKPREYGVEIAIEKLSGQTATADVDVVNR